jgi:hypothetical protein
MAENEILDVAKGRRWFRVRSLLADATPQVDRVLDEIDKRFERSFLSAVRRDPLYEILRAGDISQLALRAAVAQCKNKELARLIRDARESAGSSDPVRVASEAVALLRDRLCESVMLLAMNNSVYDSTHAGQQLERQLREHLNACSPRLEQQLASALRGGPVVVPRRRPQAAAGIRISETSLLEPYFRIPHGAKPH